MDANVWIAVGSVATAVIVFLNLYLIFIKPRLGGPALVVEFEKCTPFCRETMAKVFASGDISVATYWLRLRVKNYGRSAAKRCLSKIIKIMDSEGNIIHDFDPMHLHWVNTDWDAVPFSPIDLDRGDYEYTDILATQTNDDKMHICGDQFELSKYKGRGIKKSLEPGSYIIQITIYGDNIDPKTQYISLIWGGGNIKDMLIEIHNSIEQAKSRLRQKNVQ